MSCVSALSQLSYFISGQLPLGWQGSPRPASLLNLEQWAAWKDHLSSFLRGPFLKQRAVVSQSQGLVLVTLGWKSKGHVQLRRMVKHQTALIKSGCTSGTLVSHSIRHVGSPCSKGSGAHAVFSHRVTLLLLLLPVRSQTE